MREHGFERFLAVAGLGDHGDVAFDFEQGSERTKHHALIFGEHYANRLAVVAVSLVRGFKLGALVMFDHFVSTLRPSPAPLSEAA